MAIGVAVQSPSVFLVLSGALLWSALRPAHNPWDAIYNHVANWTGGPHVAIAPPPRQFAQGVASILALAIAAALLLNAVAVAWVVEGMLGAAVLQVVLGRFCVGAGLYHMLMRRVSIKA